MQLDSKVKLSGKIVSTVLGVAGPLLMGAGISLVMIWENMGSGLGVSGILWSHMSIRM